MSDAFLRFWGVRGSYSAPFPTHLGVGGNTSCVEIRVDDHVMVCDAGSGIIPFGNEMLKQSKIREMLVILTHYHWDHISGLPFFVPAFIPNWNITFFGPGQSKKDIEEHVSAQMGQNEILTFQKREIRCQSMVIHMHARLLVIIRALAQKQVDAAGVLDKNIGPRRIAGKKNLLALVRDFQAERNVLGLMRHAKGKDLDTHDAM